MKEYKYLERPLPKHIVKQIRADAIEELLSKLKPCVFCHDSTDCDIDYFFENCANEDCISWNELKLQAEQLKEQ